MPTSVKCKECCGRGATPEITPCLRCRRHARAYYGMGRDGTGCAKCDGTGRDYHDVPCWKCNGRGCLPRPRLSWCRHGGAYRLSVRPGGGVMREYASTAS